jgi:WD40 repeat protein
MSLAFDPTGEFLASASVDQTIGIWNVRTRTRVAVLTGHNSPVNVLAYTRDGSRLISGAEDGRVILWDARRGVALFIASPDPRRARSNDPMWNAVISLGVCTDPAGRWAVIGRENGDLIRYDLANLGNATLLPTAGGVRAI